MRPSYLGLKGAARSPGKPLTMEINIRGGRCVTARPLLTSLLSATMISSTYLVVAWTWRLCCGERAEGGEAREQEEGKGAGMIKRGEGKGKRRTDVNRTRLRTSLWKRTPLI